MEDVRASLLRKVLVNIAEQHGYENPEFQITPVPPTGSNFTSQLFHSVISAPGREDLKLFAKVAVVGEKFRSQMPTKIFDIERHFYTKLAKIYADIEVKHNIPEEHKLVMPKFYGYNDTFSEEIIVLQDLAEESFTTYDRLKSIDWEYASKAVEELAKLHALSIAYQKEYPEDYEQATSVLKREMMVSDPDAMGAMQKITEQMLQLAPEEYRDKILEVMMDAFKPESFAKFSTPLRRTVIIHSDFRQSNMMYKMHKDGSVEVVIVDYQTMHPGCAANDLIYFIFSGSDGQFRREHYERLIDHYYQHMAAALRRLDLEPEEVFPREDFDQDLKDVLPLGLVLASVMLPMMTADATELQAVEAESLQSMMGNMSTNELCAKRFNEVIEDYVTWGIL